MYDYNIFINNFCSKLKVACYYYDLDVKDLQLELGLPEDMQPISKSKHGLMINIEFILNLSKRLDINPIYFLDETISYDKLENYLTDGFKEVE